MELFDRDLSFKKSLDDAYFSKRQGVEDELSRNNSTNKPNNHDDLVVAFPSPADVLLGKGRSVQEFSGNQALNRMIGRRFEEYCSVEKLGKTGITLEIVKHIQQEGGRFLERFESVGWKVVTDDAIFRNKITQSFRFRNRSRKDGTAEPMKEVVGDEEDDDKASGSKKLRSRA